MEALDVAFANAYLAAVVAAEAGPGAEAHAKRRMLTGVLRRLDRVLGHVDDRVASWSLLRARDALAHTVGAFGRGLLVPSVPGIQHWADLLRPA
jgi:hypothetical protein